MEAKKIAAAAVLVLFIVSMVSPAHAWRFWGEKNQRSRQRDTLSKRLELSDEQRTAFREHFEKQRKGSEPGRKEIRELGARLKAELKKEKVDSRAVNDLIRKIGEKRTEMEIKRMESMLKLRENLSPEQREKFNKMLEQKEPPSRPQRRR